MLLFSAIILGIIEGITEFLPISSTGHLILAQSLLKLPITEFWKSFEISIQLGAILAVVVLYWKKIWDIKNVWGKLLVAFLPTAVIGLAFYKIVKIYLLGNSFVVLGALFVGGVVIILFERWHAKLSFRRKPESLSELTDRDSDFHWDNTADIITYKQAFYIGLFQSIAIIPGVSRSAATIIGGLALGLSRPLIVEFSFLLAVPTMAAATGLDLFKSGFDFSGREWGIMAVGFIVSFFIALIAIKWLLRYIIQHNFTIFGWYRIIISILFFVLLF